MGTSKKDMDGISEFARAFKSFSSHRINEIQNEKNGGIWQSRFCDHVVWSEKELNRIRLYIRNNAFNWSANKIKWLE
jgi:putative transposase